MKDNRAPLIADICFSLQWYLLVLSVCVVIAYSIVSDPMQTCVRLIPAAAVYAAVAMTVRLVRQRVLRMLIPAALCVGCVMLGSGVAEYILLAVLAGMAAVCGAVLHFKVDRDSGHYSGMLYFCPVLAVLSMIIWRAGMSQALTWINVISLLYLPLCAVSWMSVRSARALAVFDGRADQPLKKINKSMNRLMLAVVAVILLVSLVLPQYSEDSLLSGLAAVCFALLGGAAYLLASLLPSCTYQEEGEPTVYENMTAPEAADNSVTRIIVMVLLTALILWLAVRLFGVLRRIIAGYLRRSGRLEETEEVLVDTVEKIQPAANASEEKTSGRSNAAKIRRIYRRRIKAILGDDRALRDSLTTAEIASLCRKKGQDVTELTALYRKARYAQNCTAEDVRAAKRL